MADDKHDEEPGVIITPVAVSASACATNASAATTLVNAILRIVQIIMVYVVLVGMITSKIVSPDVTGGHIFKTLTSNISSLMGQVNSFEERHSDLGKKNLDISLLFTLILSTHLPSTTHFTGTSTTAYHPMQPTKAQKLERFNNRVIQNRLYKSSRKLKRQLLGFEPVAVPFDTVLGAAIHMPDMFPSSTTKYGRTLHYIDACSENGIFDYIAVDETTKAEQFNGEDVFFVCMPSGYTLSIVYNATMTVSDVRKQIEEKTRSPGCTRHTILLTKSVPLFSNKSMSQQLVQKGDILELQYSHQGVTVNSGMVTLLETSR